MESRASEVDVVAEHAAAIVSRLDGRLGEIVDSVQEILVGEFAEIGGNGELLDLLRDAVEGNLAAYLPAIRHRIPVEKIQPPTPALEHARRMAQRGVPANTLVRGYRLGHRALLDRLVAEIATANLDSELGLHVFQRLSAVSFAYIDSTMEEILDSHQQERDRWLTNKSRLRAVRVREALEAPDVDVDEMTTATGYPFARTHLALVVWLDGPAAGDELTRLERFAGLLCHAVAPAGRPLFVAADGLSGWVWFSVDDALVADVHMRVRSFVDAQPDAPRVVMSNPMRGLNGFRRAHRQALDVRATVLASSLPTPSFTAACDPGVQVAVRFREDLDGAREWVRSVLGDLAEDNEATERLRETLQLFLRSASSFKATADLQHLHVNSVKYRVQRAIERRGREVAEDRLDVEVALLLVRWFGGAVLA
ncbi:MAG: helix-turn-helix domain-containing protein [Mycobacterium kyogaense]|uniref:PucR family transcriptional regulator n=1 Tax=Mycobacterium kyogaense TaxID=2212479 RepID=UPI002FF8BC4C